MNIMKEQNRITLIIWASLLVGAILAGIAGRWQTAFVALATIAVSLVPLLVVPRFGIRLPRGMIAASTFFIFATLFLGEVFDFYGRYWWWDIALHGISALGFGIIGFLFVFILFKGDRYAAPAWALGLIAFCVAVTIGVLWEIFEFAMDQILDLNMQKSGLLDTMGDLIVDVTGAAIGGLAGFFYLKGQSVGGLSGLIDEFIHLNRDWFKRFRNK